MKISTNKNINRSFLKGFAVTVVLTTLSSACHDNLLDFTPATSISEGTAFSTPDKIKGQVNALYGQIAAPSFYGSRHIIFNEQRGDEFSQNDGNNSTGANVWNQSITGSGDFVNAVWTAAYASINSANILIDRLATSTVITDDVKTNYIAEAKFARAFAYFSLVQTYARPYNQNSGSPALPLRLEAETTGGNNDLAFSTVAEVYTQILKDLDDAEKGLPDGYATAILNASRAHKATAIALKTRVYLVQSNYDKVIEEAEKIVPDVAPYAYTAGAVTHSLEADFTKLFAGAYLGSEAVFSIPFVIASEAPALQSALASNYLTPVINLSATGIVSDPVFSGASTDLRKSLITTNATGQKLLKKFPKNAAPYTDYVPLMNYAEAAAQNNDLARALSLLSAVRRRADAAFTFTTGVGTREDLVQTILNERRIELLGEGFRTPDLFRLVQALPAKTGNAGTAPQIQPTEARYVWPIPSNELAYNKLAPR
jgi:hypothetical protein